MARLPIQDPESATSSNKEIFGAMQKSLGKVPNMARVMGNSPAVLKGYAQFSGALGGGALPAGIRERIALLSAERNECDYCRAAHTAIGGMVGLKPDQMDAARGGNSSDPKAAAALAFAGAVMESRGGVSDEQVRAARAGGLSDAELAEVVGAVALNALTNYFNRAFEVDVDFPAVRPLAGAGVA